MKAVPASREKIVWGFRKIVSLVKGYVRSSTHIPTADKDGLIRQLDELVETLEDAQTRAAGSSPYTPAQLKQMKASVSASRSS